MESKRSDNRRRRVLFDENVQQAGAQSAPTGLPPGSKRRRSLNYGPRGNHQLKTSDLIPTRWFSLGAIAACSLLAVVIVNILDAWVLRPTGAATDAIRQAFQLESPTGISTWLSSAAFIFAALFGLQTFAMRRHRRDDYRGTYRVWLVFSAICLFASIQCVVPLNEVGRWFLLDAARPSAILKNEMGIAIIKLLILVAIFIRMQIELRHCRLASVLLVASLAIYSISIAGETSLLGARFGLNARWITENVGLLGALTLLHCSLAYSRYVSLDVQGLVRRRTKRSRKRKSRSTRSRSSRSVPAASPSAASRTPQPVATSTSPSAARTIVTPNSKPSTGPSSSTASRETVRSGPLKAKLDALQSSSSDDDNDDSWDDDAQESSGPSSQRLSKAERRRLKKLQRHQRHAA